MIVHQMLPNFSIGDAIGDDTRALQKILRNLGHTSDIFAGVIHPYLNDQACHWKKYKSMSHPDNILIYHFSVGSEITDYLLEIPDRLILIFHNITPAEWFFGFSPHMTELAQDGFNQLKKLLSRTEAVWADSAYNVDMMKEIGFENVKELPIIIDFARLDIQSNEVFRQQFKSTQKTWLFTGRLSPNKCHEDIVKAFAVYKKCLNHHSRLILVGDERNCYKYVQSIIKLIESSGVSDVQITGMLDDDEWATLFRMSDLFLCMSEHEGFCVPLLEAMYFDIPVIAFDAGAVRGTLGGAGVLLKDKNPKITAEIAHHLLSDEDLKQNVLHKQRKRLEQYRNRDYQAEVEQLLKELG